MVIKNAIKSITRTRVFPAAPPSLAWRCGQAITACWIYRSPAIRGKSFKVGGGREQDPGDGAGGVATRGILLTFWLQGRPCGQQPLKQLDYRFLVAEHACYCILHLVQASEDVCYGRPDLSHLYLYGIELRGVGRDVHNLDCIARTGDVIPHSLAGEGSGVAGYAPYLVTLAGISYKINVAARLQVLVELHVQSTGSQRSHEVYRLRVVGADHVLPNLPPEPPARCGRVPQRGRVGGQYGVVLFFPFGDYAPHFFYKLHLFFGYSAVVGYELRLSDLESEPVRQLQGGPPATYNAEPFQYALGYHLEVLAAAPKTALVWRYVEIPPCGTLLLQAKSARPTQALVVVPTLQALVLYLVQPPRDGARLAPHDFGYQLNLPAALSQYSSLKPVSRLAGALVFVHFQYRQWHVRQVLLPILYSHCPRYGGLGDVWYLYLSVCSQFLHSL